MDDLPIYFDATTGVYRLLEDADEDSGVEELPFSSYLSIKESEAATNALIDSQRPGYSQDQGCELEEDDLTYVDDDRDDDYRPNKSVYVPKKSKTKRRPYGQYTEHLSQGQYSQHQSQYTEYSEEVYSEDHYNSQYTDYGLHDDGLHGNSYYGNHMYTPDKQGIDLLSDPDSSGSTIRHYARKDRTPRTIMKMMEKHRESERVRHHTLNESMKDVCMRVPGYDPDVKETKVIQMQRIIGYECFLENTLADMCTQLGIQPKTLHMGTNFITDAMKDTPIEEFYKPSHYKTSDIDEDDDTNDGYTYKGRTTRYKLDNNNNNSSMNKNIITYKRDKISSPTVDSTTDNVIKIYPGSHSPAVTPTGPLSDTRTDIQDSCWPTQSFIPIESSQDLFSSQDSIATPAVKVETITEDDVRFNDIDTLIDQRLCREEEISTASFMRDEMPTSTNNDDNDEFSLSSPVRYNNHVFIHSPPASGMWHSSFSRLHCTDKGDTPKGKEMVTVSPENILETLPKLEPVESPTATASPWTPQASPGMAYSFNSSIRPLTAILSPSLRKSHSDQTLTLSVNNHLGTSSRVSYGSDPCFGKLYRNIHTQPGTKQVEQSYNHKQIQPNMVRCKIQTAGSSSTRATPSFMKNENSKPVTVGSESLDSQVGAAFMSPTGKNKRKRYTPLRSPFLDVTNQTDGVGEDDQEEQASVTKILKICHVKDNRNCDSIGFQTNTSHVTIRSNVDEQSVPETVPYKRTNPGVHSSHIQKMLGHVWRNMSQEQQQPYRDKAKHSSSSRLPQCEDPTQPCHSDSVVPSSTSMEEDMCM